MNEPVRGERTVRSGRRIVVGPTAAGKSAIAMQLAHEFGLAIISADSRQIYAGFDIGTAKPTPEERARVPHFGIDILDPSRRYSAHQFAHDAKEWTQAAARDGRESVVVGGTGFYVRALVEPLDLMPSLDADRRVQMEGFLSTLSGDEIERWCRRLDPARASLGRTQRLRAIETALLSGTRVSDWHGRQDSGTRRDTDRYLLVDPGALLAERIELRVRSMVTEGWVDETARLAARVPLDAPAWKASGYATMLAVVNNAVPLRVAVERIVVETRQYAKRQRTWFRHQLPSEQVTQLDPTAPDAFERARMWWESEDGSGA